MRKLVIAGGVLAAVFVAGFLALVVWYRMYGMDAEQPVAVHADAPAPPAHDETPSAPPAPPPAGAVEAPGFLYGRVTSLDGTAYEGRLRWGNGEEAFWSDYFNGAKPENRWIGYVPPGRLPKQSHSVDIFGWKVGQHDAPVELGRLFMARFGDIARVEPSGRTVRVTLKSGTVFDLARFEASDFDDGLRVWDPARGVVDFDSLQVRSIEFRPTAKIADPPIRLHGTVRTREAEFTGFIQWDRIACVGTDALEGRVDDRAQSVRFDTIRSIARDEGHSIRVTTVIEGADLVLAGARAVRGIYVDDPRFGRVLISWDAFTRLDFSPAGSGPAYGDFAPGRPLTGRVTARDGRRLTGKIVYDLDESETTETFDAPSRGVDYTIPFGMLASIVPEHGRATLRNGEALQLAAFGDLAPTNAGMLVFTEGQERPEYLRWIEVERVDFD